MESKLYSECNIFARDVEFLQSARPDSRQLWPEGSLCQSLPTICNRAWARALRCVASWSAVLRAASDREQEILKADAQENAVLLRLLR